MRRVELGAGGGLVGLAMARGCSVNMPIYITDQESMLPLMEENIKINGLSNVKAVVLNWGRPPPSSIPARPAVVLAADCVYFEPAFPLLISTLEQLLGPESVCYFCFKRRRRADMRCIKQIKKIFDVVEIRDYADYDIHARANLFLYKIKSRGFNKDDAALDSPTHVKTE
jgi:predicted nicotinamide N-methyase